MRRVLDAAAGAGAGDDDEAAMPGSVCCTRRTVGAFGGGDASAIVRSTIDELRTSPNCSFSAPDNEVTEMMAVEVERRTPTFVAEVFTEFAVRKAHDRAEAVGGGHDELLGVRRPTEVGDLRAMNALDERDGKVLFGVVERDAVDRRHRKHHSITKNADQTRLCQSVHQSIQNRVNVFVPLGAERL